MPFEVRAVPCEWRVHAQLTILGIILSDQSAALLEFPGSVQPVLETVYAAAQALQLDQMTVAVFPTADVLDLAVRGLSSRGSAAELRDGFGAGRFFPVPVGTLGSLMELRGMH